MFGLDDRLDYEIRRLAAGVDGRGAYALVARRKRRRRVIRRAQTVALAAAIVATSAGGVLALTRAFTPATRPAEDPIVAPTLSPAPEPFGGACPHPMDKTYPGEPIGRSSTADVIGDRNPARVTIYGQEDRPARCRYFLVVEHSDGDTGRAFNVPITVFDWLPIPPSIFAIAEIDGQPGLEVVIEFGGPGHPHRTGEVFTYVPHGPPGDGSIERMALDPSFMPYSGIPLHGEFPAAVDCTGKPGTIVVTLAEFAPGGDDSVYGVTRTFFWADGTSFVETRAEESVVEVGTEDERWPELADDSFRSCPRG